MTTYKEEAIALGEKLRTARQQKELTQDGLAQKLLVSRETVTAHESGRCVPDFFRLKKMAVILEIDLNSL